MRVNIGGVPAFTVHGACWVTLDLAVLSDLLLFTSAGRDRMAGQSWKKLAWEQANLAVIEVIRTSGFLSLKRAKCRIPNYRQFGCYKCKNVIDKKATVLPLSL